MSESNSSAQAGGIGFLGLLTLLFIGLKLTHVINWSWWWVLAPSLVPIGIFMAFLLVAGLGFAAVFIMNLARHKRHR